MSEPKTLQGHIALITGASKGIGRALALTLAQYGAHIIALSRTQGALEELDDDITALGGACTLLPIDLNRLDKIDAIGPSIAERFGRLDILALNAGTLGTLGPITHTAPKDWEKVFTLNVHAPYRLLRTLEPLLMQSPDPHVLISGCAASEPLAYWGAYRASKTALAQMAKTYAQETRGRIPVHMLDLPFVRTELLKAAFPGGYKGHTISAEEAAQQFLDTMFSHQRADQAP